MCVFKLNNIHLVSWPVLRRFGRCARVLAKSAYQLRPFLCLSVPLSQCISSTPSGQVSAKFRIGGFYENISRGNTGI